MHDPGMRQGCHSASTFLWWINRCPSNSLSSFRAIRQVISWSTVVTCSAGTPISITSIFSEANNTRCRILAAGSPITSMQAKFRPLILINKINPASDAENQLKPDRVIMNHIRHRPTIGDANMAGNDRPPSLSGIKSRNACQPGL